MNYDNYQTLKIELGSQNKLTWVSNNIIIKFVDCWFDVKSSVITDLIVKKNYYYNILIYYINLKV